MVLLGDDFPKAPMPKTPAASSLALGPLLTAASATKTPQQQRNVNSRITSDTRRNSGTKTLAPSPITQTVRPVQTEPIKSRRTSKIHCN